MTAQRRDGLFNAIEELAIETREVFAVPEC